jgi:hypothetical protein
MDESTFVGLDVHARSVKAAVLNARSGVVTTCDAPARSEALVAWLAGLPGPLSVAYEAGPTGYVRGSLILESRRCSLLLVFSLACWAKHHRRCSTECRYGSSVSAITAPQPIAAGRRNRFGAAALSRNAS